MRIPVNQILEWRSSKGHSSLTSFVDMQTADEKATPLVLIHGVGMNWKFWQPQLGHFSRSRRVIAYDMLGHGGSSLPSTDEDLGAFAEQLDSLLTHLSLSSVDVAGHSMGGLVGLEFALDHPARVRSLAVLSSVFCRTPAQRAAVEQRASLLSDPASHSTVASNTISRWFPDPVGDGLRVLKEDVHALLSSADPVGYERAYRLFATSDERFRDRITTLQMPALFMTGELDANSPPSMSEAMARLAPLGRALTMAGQRHLMTLTAPDAVNRALERFHSAAAITLSD